MKILHIAPIGRFAEGIGTVLQSLVPNQISQGQDVRIVSTFENRLYPELPIITIYSKKALECLVCNWLPDIVIFHSLFNVRYCFFYRIIINHHIPYLIQLHGALSLENYNKNTLRKRVAMLMWVNRFIRTARSIIYLNEREYNNSIVPRINQEHIIIPNGCTNNCNIIEEKKVDGKLQIIYIGRIDYRQKGLDILIGALKLLNTNDVSGYQMSFYGNEVDIDTVRLKQDIAGLKNVFYKGGVYGEEKGKVLRDADLFLLTSRYEGMPMGVLEAWSYAVPCVLTAGTNMIDGPYDTNYYWFAEFDSKSVAKALLRAMEQYRRKPEKYRKAAFSEAEKYGWERIAALSISQYSRFALPIQRK